MELNLYGKRNLEGNKKWYLCEGCLFNYLSELRPEFFNYDIQRKIVENDYLKTLGDTVEKGMPFPAITLSSADDISKTECAGESTGNLDVSKVEILDGLQRTFRLWGLYYFWQFTGKYGDAQIPDIYSDFKADIYGEAILKAKVLNQTNIRSLIDSENGYKRIDKLIDSFRNYRVVFNIWHGLSAEDEVKQMLILNAGQKSVSPIHQFELIYLHYFSKDSLHVDRNVRILREKDNDYAKLKDKQWRPAGTYALSTIMIAFQSYFRGKPLRVKRINKLNFEEDAISSSFGKALVESVLSKFINIVYELDCKLASNDNVRNWFGKDTTLSGIFAAFGQQADPDQPYDDFGKISDFIDKVKVDDINIDGFYRTYNSLSSSRLNLGTIVRRAICNAFLNYKEGNKIDWESAFRL